MSPYLLMGWNLSHCAKLNKQLNRKNCTLNKQTLKDKHRNEKGMFFHGTYSSLRYVICQKQEREIKLILFFDSFLQQGNCTLISWAKCTALWIKFYMYLDSLQNPSAFGVESKSWQHLDEYKLSSTFI